MWIFKTGLTRMHFSDNTQFRKQSAPEHYRASAPMSSGAHETKNASPYNSSDIPNSYVSVYDECLLANWYWLTGIFEERAV